MLKNSLNSKYLTQKNPKQLSPSLKLLLAFVIMVTSLTLISPEPAGAKPNEQWMTSTIEIQPGGEITLCKGEKKTVVVTLTVRTYRFADLLSGSGSPSNPPNQQIQARAPHSDIASAFLGSTSLQPQDRGLQLLLSRSMPMMKVRLR
jgi:hypothetical protein